MNKIKNNMTLQIFIALIFAIVLGLLMQNNVDFANNYIRPFGNIFLNLLKFVVAPIVLFSIIGGVVSMRDIKKVGEVGGLTILYYMLTTSLAITIGLFIANFSKKFFPILETSGLDYKASETVSFMDTIVNIFPSNILQPLVEANMLQVIVIALFIGFAILLISKEKSEKAIKSIEIINDIFLKIMQIILNLSPIGVFCLLMPVIAENGPVIIGSLASVLLVAYVCYTLHAILVYSATVKFIGSMSPIKFFKTMVPAMIFAFSSASSMGTLPINMKSCQEMGANKDIVSFVLPLGATINMDGTAIYQGVCAVFIATCFGIDLTIGQMINIVLTATLASIGTAGVPGSGVVMLTMVLQAVGLPIEGIALVAGIDRLFDMGRTVLNITGDASCAIIVSNIMKKSKKIS